MKAKRRPTTPLPWKAAGYFEAAAASSHYPYTKLSDEHFFAVHAANACQPLVRFLHEVLMDPPEGSSLIDKAGELLRDLGEF
jgi:hypothetical protein